MQIILSAIFIYLAIQCFRFIARIRFNKSRNQNNQNVKNSYKNLDIQDADYEDIDQKP